MDASPQSPARPILWDDPDTLARRLAPVHARMAAAVAGRPEVAGLYDWLRYHLGWADLDGRPAAARAAKGIRPAVALIASAAVGAPEARAVDAAAAVELTHEFSLIHDDLEDGDALRRGRPALWAEVGAPQAINAGDALFTIARGVLSHAPMPADIAVDMLRRYDAACQALAEGQYLDLRFETAGQVSPAEYEVMVRGKTGALLGAAAALGARAGGASPALADALARYGEAVGIAFQIQDDVLGLWGDPAVTGKPAGADLVRRKRSLPVILGLADPILAPDLRRFFGQDERDAAVAAQLAARMAAGGLQVAVTEAAMGWSEAACGHLAALDLSPGPRAELLALAQAAVARRR